MPQFDDMQGAGLDGCSADRKGAAMTRTPLIITLAVAAALAGCSKESHTIVAGGGPADDAQANAASKPKIELPPAIVATKTYRCDDNSVVTVDYLADGKSANVRAGEGATSTLVRAPEAGKAMTADGGYSLEGSPTAGSAKIAVPGHSSQSCKG